MPDVRRLSLSDAEARLQAQPLAASSSTSTRNRCRGPGLVVDQVPKRGYRSSYDRIILVVTKPRHGVIPKLVGVPLEKALLRLRKLKLVADVTYATGKPGTCSSRDPPPGLAAAPGLRVELVVARGAARAVAGG